MMKAKPFVKWAGGKGSLIPELEKHFPTDISSKKDLIYVEPFLGGGAMLFHMLGKYDNIKQVIANDINVDLIKSYKAIQCEPKKFISKLKDLERQYLEKTLEARKEFYLELRKIYNTMPRGGNELEREIFFVFLNRTCFNGLYRENKNGEFNVPFGKYEKPCICNEEIIWADHHLLQKVDFLCGSYENVYDGIDSSANTFVYFDPPYRPLSESSNFKDYNSSGFGDEEQKALKKFCDKVYDMNCKLMLSNSDSYNNDGTHFFKDIYQIKDEDFFFTDTDVRQHIDADINMDERHVYNAVSIYAPRYINAFAAKRTKITEILIRNYKTL